MNSVYLVSYDLNKAGQDYSGLYAELKKSPSWWHNLDSTWLIYTSESADAVWQRIAPHVDKNDSALIIKVQGGTHNRAGWLTEAAWNWINQHLG